MDANENFKEPAEQGVSIVDEAALALRIRHVFSEEAPGLLRRFAPGASLGEGPAAAGPALEVRLFSRQIPFFRIELGESAPQAVLLAGPAQANAIARAEYALAFSRFGFSAEDFARFALLHEIGHAQSALAIHGAKTAWRQGGRAGLDAYFKQMRESAPGLFHPDLAEDLLERLSAGQSFYQAWAGARETAPFAAVYSDAFSLRTKSGKHAAQDEAYADLFAVRSGAELYGWDPERALLALQAFRSLAGEPSDPDHQTSGALALAQEGLRKPSYNLTAAAFEETALALSCKMAEAAETDCSPRQDALAGDARPERLFYAPDSPPSPGQWRKSRGPDAPAQSPRIASPGSPPAL